MRRASWWTVDILLLGLATLLWTAARLLTDAVRHRRRRAAVPR